MKSVTDTLIVFFRYVRMVVEATAHELIRKVKHCQDQVQQKAVL